MIRCCFIQYVYNCLVCLFTCLAPIRSFRQWIVRKFVYRPPPCSYIMEEQGGRHTFIPVDVMEEPSSPLMSQVALLGMRPSKDFTLNANLHFYTSYNVPQLIVKSRSASSKYRRQKMKLIDADDSNKSWDIQPHEKFSQMDINIQAYKLRTGDNPEFAVLFISTPSDQVLLFSHGNATDLGYMLNTLMDLALQCNVSILAYEYEGYGQSRAIASDFSQIENIREAYRFLTDELNYRQSNIILYGFSIGSGPTTVLASKTNCGGVIIHSGLSSGLRILNHRTEYNKYDIFPNFEFMKEVSAPVYILHGGMDRMIDVIHAQQLSEYCQHLFSVWLAESAGHTDIEEAYREQYLMRLRSFLNYCRKPQFVKEQSHKRDHLYDMLFEDRSSEYTIEV